MQEYVNEAKKVEKNDDFLREAYDHELSARKAEREAGFEEGHISGFEEGCISELSNIVKVMYSKGLKAHEIEELTEISMEDINKIISKVDEEK